jgi:hemin uptake protein HemP
MPARRLQDETTLPPFGADATTAEPSTPAVQAAGFGPPRTASSVKSSPGRRWRSTELFGPAQEIEIEHGQAVYRLRRTSLGKLILTK